MNVSYRFISKVTPWEHFEQRFVLLICEVSEDENFNIYLKGGSRLFFQYNIWTTSVYIHIPRSTSKFTLQQKSHVCDMMHIFERIHVHIVMRFYHQAWNIIQWGITKYFAYNAVLRSQIQRILFYEESNLNKIIRIVLYKNLCLFFVVYKEFIRCSCSNYISE